MINQLPLITIHGAGFSGLSFCQLAYGMKEDFCTISIDLRGHGFSIKSQDLSYEQFSKDLNYLIPQIIEQQYKLNNYQLQSQYPIVILGHSLGGSLATSLYDNNKLLVCCTVIIDIAEEVAIRSLSNMRRIESQLDRKYISYDQVINSFSKILNSNQSIQLQLKGLVQQDNNYLITRFRFLQSDNYWNSWFTGLNKRFLSSQGYKYLIVGNYQKLDPEQEIAFSQGILGLDIIQCGHNIHEERPVDFIYSLQKFLRRLHLTGKLYNIKIDYTKGILNYEEPDHKAVIENQLEEAWNQCNN